MPSGAEQPPLNKLTGLGVDLAMGTKRAANVPVEAFAAIAITSANTADPADSSGIADVATRSARVAVVSDDCCQEDE